MGTRARSASASVSGACHTPRATRGHALRAEGSRRSRCRKRLSSANTGSSTSRKSATASASVAKTPPAPRISRLGPMSDATTTTSRASASRTESGSPSQAVQCRYAVATRCGRGAPRAAASRTGIPADFSASRPSTPRESPPPPSTPPPPRRGPRRGSSRTPRAGAGAACAPWPPHGRDPEADRPERVTTRCGLSSRMPLRTRSTVGAPRSHASAASLLRRRRSRSLGGRPAAPRPGRASAGIGRPRVAPRRTHWARRQWGRRRRPSTRRSRRRTSAGARRPVARAIRGPYLPRRAYLRAGVRCVQGSR